MRIEPPPSLPWASGTMPAATAAAAPPDEPPGVRSVSQGLRVGPKRRGSVTGRIPNSGRFVLPTMHEARLAQPAHDEGVVAGDEVAEQRPSPSVYGMPATAAVSLMAIGTPANGRGRPRRDASAAARAPSASTWTNALSSRVERLDAPEAASASSRERDLARSRTRRGELGGRPEEELRVHGGASLRSGAGLEGG